MRPKYEVPLIIHNQRREETVVEIAETLNYLKTVTDDIFSRINKRIDVNYARIGNINRRVDIATEKVAALSNAKHATQIYSSAKYPASHLNMRYKSMFTDNGPTVPVQKFEHDFKDVDKSDEPLETLQFYHVKINDQTMKEKIEIPKDISNVNDILLFNTGYNVYGKSNETPNCNIMKDNLQKTDTVKYSEIGDAPPSISQRVGLTKQMGPTSSYTYSPNLGAVPSLNVPMDLPDLPGIADDLRFTDSLTLETAPMTVKTELPKLPADENLPALPLVEEVTLPKLSEEKPLPPIPIVGDVDKEIEEIKPEEHISLPPAPSTTPPTITDITPKVDTPSPIAPDLRSSLMEAIRQAGGMKKLKSVESSPKEDQKSSAALGKSSPTGDLMADLHAKLQMRRKGISGPKIGAGTAMEKISAMIPPPSANTSNDDNQEDDDWDD